MSRLLNEDFLLEFFKSCLASSSVLETGIAHLKPTYLPSKHYKSLWSGIQSHYKVHSTLPTVGILGQMFADNVEVLSLLSNMKDVGMPEREPLIDQLERYIKNAKFRTAYEELYKIFSSGQEEKAYEAMEEFAEDLTAFSIKSHYFDKVFEDFDKRMTSRVPRDESVNQNNFRIPFGMDELDHITRGGISPGDIACFLAQSGVGKSKILKWIGVHAARLGYKVAHFQAEGTKKESLDLYDATWSGVLLHSLEEGAVTDVQRVRIDKTINNMKHLGGEIYVEAYEQFGTASMSDVRESIIELEKTNGKIDLVLIDYLEKLDPGDGKVYKVEQEKARREAIAQKMKNIAVEFDTRIVTATQAHGIDQSLLDKPEYYMTRFNTSQGKNLVDPFSFFITMNQTPDEKNKRIMRLYMDKIRKYKSGQLVHIYQNYEFEKFYDRMKTIKEFYKPK